MVPDTPIEAEHLLHIIRSYRDICDQERSLVTKRLHNTILHLQFLQHEVKAAETKLHAADIDVGTICAMIRVKGLSISFDVSCEECSAKSGDIFL